MPFPQSLDCYLRQSDGIQGARHAPTTAIDHLAGACHGRRGRHLYPNALFARNRKRHSGRDADRDSRSRTWSLLGANRAVQPFTECNSCSRSSRARMESINAEQSHPGLDHRFAPLSIDEALEGLGGRWLSQLRDRRGEGVVRAYRSRHRVRRRTEPHTDQARRCRAESSKYFRPYPTANRRRKSALRPRDRYRPELLGMSIVNTFTGDAKTEEEREAYFANVADLCDKAESSASRSAWKPIATCCRPRRSASIFWRESTDRACSASTTTRASRLLHRGRSVRGHRLRAAAAGPFPFQGQIGGEGVFNFPPPGDGEI